MRSKLGLTISHLRGASDSGMPTVYDGEDCTRPLAGDDDRCLAALRSGSSPGRCSARSCYVTNLNPTTARNCEVSRLPRATASTALALANVVGPVTARGQSTPRCRRKPLPLAASALVVNAIVFDGRTLRLAVSYRVPEIVTRGRFPDGGESDSAWRTQEARHVGSDTIAPGF